MKATPMTQQDKTKILEWISGNTLTFRGVISGDYIDKDDLTTFIESLSTEDFETLQDGDWCEVANEDQAKTIWLTEGSEYTNRLTIEVSVHEGHIFFTDEIDCPMLMTNAKDRSSRLRTKLTVEEFEQRARNIFNTPKP